MDLNTNLLGRIVTKHPELVKPNQSIFPATGEVEEDNGSVNDSGVDIPDVGTPVKQLKSVVFVPETPSPIFQRTSSKRERNDNKHTDDEDNFSKRTCQFSSDRFELPSTSIFSKFASPHKSEESVRANDQLPTAGDELTDARECSSDSAISSHHPCKSVSQNEKQKQIRARRFQKEGTKLAVGPNKNSSCQNGYKNAHYGTGYIGWPSDSDSDDSDIDHVSLRTVINQRELTNNVTKEKTKEDHDQLNQKDVTTCKNSLDVDKLQGARDEKPKIDNKNSSIYSSNKNNSSCRDKRVIIPRSELTIRNIFDSNKVSNSRLKTNNGRSFRPTHVHSAAGVERSSCRYASANLNCHPLAVDVSGDDHQENNLEQTSVSSSSQIFSSCSVANHIPAIITTANCSIANMSSSTSANQNPNPACHSSPTMSVTNSNSDSLSITHVSPSHGQAHPVVSGDNITPPDSSHTDKQHSVTEFPPHHTSPRFHSRYNSGRQFHRPTVDSAGFISLHPELHIPNRPSCRFSHAPGDGGVDMSRPQGGGDRGDSSDNDVILLDSPGADDGRPPVFDLALSARRSRTAARRKSRVSGLRRADAVSGHYPHRPDPVVDVDVDVSLINQLENDEQLARRLQEEMDMELAMSLHQAHSAMDAGSFPAYFDMTGAGTHAGYFDMSAGGAASFQPHVSPVHRRGYNSARHPNTRSRRRHRGSDDLLLAIDGEGPQNVMLPFHQRVDMDGHNPLAMMEAHILSLLENPGRRGRRRGSGGRSSRNILLGLGHSGEGNDYEELLALAENLGDVKSKGISTAEIDRLPTRDYRRPAGEGGEVDDCLICMCEYREGERQRILTCFHEFHAKCIDKWLKSSATCPVCRVDVRM